MTKKKTSLQEYELLESGIKNSQIKLNRHKLELTHLDKIFWEKEGYTKGDLINYYHAVADYILPYLKKRPQSLLRNPNGIKDKGFFQKNIDDHAPGWTKTKTIYSESSRRDVHYLICNDEATLLYMINLGCIEINPWHSRINKLGKPDYGILDLDPTDTSFDNVIITAKEVKKLLDDLEIDGFCKTSGASGLHIYFPMNARYPYDEVKDFVELLAIAAHQRLPDITSMERDTNKRKGKVYLDYLQNAEGQTIASPYCVRPQPGATVSTPLYWEELDKNIFPGDFTIKSIPKRLKEIGDIFEPSLGKSIPIKVTAKKLQEILKKK